MLEREREHRLENRLKLNKLWLFWTQEHYNIFIGTDIDGKNDESMNRKEHNIKVRSKVNSGM